MNIFNIKLNDKHNIRDFSYIINKEGYKIKKNCFIRADSLFDYSNLDINTLVNDYKLKTIIDLRYDEEIVDCVYSIDNVKYYNISLLKHSRRGVTHEKNNKVKIDKVPNLCEIYKEIITSRYSKKQIKKIFKIIMNKKNSCVLFHCTIGKDRTGIIALLLLSMLDVDINDIRDDYMFTNTFTEEISNKMYDVYLEKSKSKEYALQQKDFYLAKEEYINYIIDYMIGKSGSIINYIINEIGISKRKIDKFKDDFLIK